MTQLKVWESLIRHLHKSIWKPKHLTFVSDVWRFPSPASNSFFKCHVQHILAVLPFAGVSIRLYFSWFMNSHAFFSFSLLEPVFWHCTACCLLFPPRQQYSYTKCHFLACTWERGLLAPRPPQWVRETEREMESPKRQKYSGNKVSETHIFLGEDPRPLALVLKSSPFLSSMVGTEAEIILSRSLPSVATKC